MNRHLAADVAELRQLILDDRREQERDEPRQPSAPDGPWWFAGRDMLRAESQ